MAAPELVVAVHDLLWLVAGLAIVNSASCSSAFETAEALLVT
ncbi:uncharacterized protein FRV6_13903 [Fusarium oxysporum]|uniref:Uncharacterized protein n=1 Tax=Fusarium oxysporum TaxID=5507 RepID=A0A2H3TQ32_FUSOX|nr:uncharacterized protein FRV6_13903 [Fusarium oxysporum]